MKHPAEYVSPHGVYPIFPPPQYRIVEEWGNGYALKHQSNGLRVLIDVRFVEETDKASQAWLHVSFSRASRLPSWEDTKNVKADFIGDNVAIQVFPRTEDYVNIHQFCLHLWHRVDGESCPNFTAEVGGQKSI